MKKSLALFILVAGFTAAAATSAISDLNTAITNLLQPFQTATTQASLTFTELETRSERPLALSLFGHYYKSGPVTAFEIDLNELTYTNPDGKSPTARVSGRINTELTKLVKQEVLNTVLREIEASFHKFVEAYTSQYGEAVTAEAKVTEFVEEVVNGEERVLAVGGRIYANIDLSKLPQNENREDVVITQLRADLRLDVRTGLTFSVVVNSNPEYKDFNEQDIKDTITRLLQQDTVIMEQIRNMFKQIDNGAEAIVNGAF